MEAAQSGPQMRSRPSILLIEDDPDIVRVLLRLLMGVTDGYDVVVVCDASQVLTYLRSQPVSLVITDYALLGMTGLALTELIKQESPQTRVMLISGNPSLASEVGIEHVDNYLAKPFPLDRLEQIVHTLLG
jgi:DNA-binding NtrC family response regulator